MKHKQIGYSSAALLHRLNKKNIEIFSFAGAMRLMTGYSKERLANLLSSMVKRGLLMRIKRGHYHVIPYDMDSSVYMPDWHSLAKHLAYDKFRRDNLRITWDRWGSKVE